MTDEVAEKWELPIALRLDPSNPDHQALLAQAERQQQAWEAKSAKPFASQSPVDLERSHALIKIKSKEAALVGMSLDDPGYCNLTAQLGEAYATIGRFDKAAEVDARPAYRREYLSLWNALMRDDGETCECQTRPRQTHERTTREQEVWSIRHNRAMPIMKCPLCGHRNITGLHSHVAVQDEQRATFKTAIESGMSSDKAKALALQPK